MPAQTRIDLHLRIRLKPGQRDTFFAFLREAIPVYTRPGGIDIRLLEDLTDDHRFIELVVYANEAAYQRDQVRVNADPEMIELLQRWRSHLAEPPVIEAYRFGLPWDP